MNSLPSWLIPATLHGSLAIVFVAAAAPLLRRWLGAQAAYLLWAVVLAHLLLPWLPASPVPWPATAFPSNPSPKGAKSAFRISGSVEPARETTPPPSLASPPSAPASAWALHIWLTGIAIVLGFSAVRSLRAGRLARRSRDISQNPTLKSALSSFGGNLARLRIRETLELKSPALCGIWRPTILLPTGWETRLSAFELECVLLHEIGHLKRGDLLWRWIFQVARTIHWFNPLVWIAERSAQVHQEMACDEWVLLRKNAPTLAIYGEALLTLAQRVDTAPVAFPLQAGMAESRIGMKRRLHHLTAIRAHGWRAAAAGLLIAGGALLLTGPAKSITSPTPPDVSPSKGPAVSSSQKPLPNPPAKPRPKINQVQIESKFVQIPDELADKLLETSTDTALMGVQAVYTNIQFQRILRSLDQQKDIDLMSAPRVTARASQRAVINIVREFRYPTEFVPPNIQTPVATPTAFETRNLGIELEVESNITANDAIDLTLSPRVTEFTGFVNFGGSRAAKENLESDAVADTFQTVPNASGVINQPIFSVRQVTTSITLESGQTALVGCIQAADTSDLQDSFGSHQPSPKKPKRSLFIFVTATLINTEGNPPSSPAPSPALARPSQPSATPRISASGMPYGVPVAGKPGFVTSPYAPDRGYVDVRGFNPNTEVKDPYTGKMFLVP